jgi:hypothetical protein
MIDTPTLMKIGSSIQKLIRGYTDRKEIAKAYFKIVG